MKINELIAIVKKKLETKIVMQDLIIEDKSFLHKNHKAHQEGKFHLKLSIQSDELIKLETLDAFIDKRSIPFLKDAEVNFDHDNFGGQLTIKAPNARFPNISPNSPVEDRINYVIYNEINPMLESHGGEVSLVKFTETKEAVLQFGGGCQGCGMVDVTLKDGIEKTLIEQIPELKSVVDITDHSDSENAFYKP